VLVVGRGGWCGVWGVGVGGGEGGGEVGERKWEGEMGRVGVTVVLGVSFHSTLLYPLTWSMVLRLLSWRLRWTQLLALRSCTSISMNLILEVTLPFLMISAIRLKYLSMSCYGRYMNSES